jgi:hypothetical protein
MCYDEFRASLKCSPQKGAPVPDTQQVRLRELLANELRPADTHPGYGWTAATARDLLADLEWLHGRRREAGDDEDPTHHLGTVVLREADDGLRVVDGYARLVVVTAVLDKLGVDLPGRALLSSTGRDRDEFHSYPESSSVTELRLTDPQLDPRDIVKLVSEWLDSHVNHDAVTDALLDGVTVTVHHVDSTAEAGAVRAAATRPGTGTTETERVTNGFMTRCRRVDAPDIADEVVYLADRVTHFANMLESVTAGTNRDADDLLEIYWRTYWEPDWEPDSDESVAWRILQDERYASNERDNTAARHWISSYLRKLQETTEAYSRVESCTDSVQSRFSDSWPGELDRRLERLRSLTTEPSIISVQLAATSRFGLGEQTAELLDLMETLVVRVNWVYGRDAATNAIQPRLRRAAFELAWAGRADEYQTASRELPFDVPESLIDGYERAWWRLQSAIGRAAPDAAFERALTREDVRDGSRAADGWSGVDDRTLTFLLASYNHHVLDDSQFDTVSTDDLGLDQVWDRTADDLPIGEAQRYRATRRRLGNFVLLPAEETPTDQLPYELKHSRYYQGVDRPALVRELPTPSSVDSRAWEPEEITARTDKITAFALDHWGVTPGANVTLAADELAPETERRLRQLVRERFDPSASFVPAGLDALPRVTVDAREMYPPATHERTCPACGGSSVRIADNNGVLSFYCSCGEALDGPLASFHFPEP